jgi:hypothetical protein
MNDNIRNKLIHYSETPPAAAWPRIAAALDTPAFAQKLQNFETPPPAQTWERLEQQLTQAPVVSLRTKLFKYAIAAAVLLIIAAGSIFYFTIKPTNLAGNTPDTASTRDTKTTFLADTQHHTKYKTALASEETTDLRSNTSEPTASLGQEQVQFSPQVQIANKRLTADPATVAPKEKLTLATELPDRYMIATTATGKVVRLPKKAYSDYACAEMLQNYQCKEKLQAIQSKMAASVAIDFTDFIDLLKKLQDNP